MPATFIITTPSHLCMFEHVDKIDLVCSWLVKNPETNSNLVIAKINAPNKWFKQKDSKIIRVHKKYTHQISTDVPLAEDVIRTWNLQPTVGQMGNLGFTTLAYFHTNEKAELFNKLNPSCTIHLIP